MKEKSSYYNVIETLVSLFTVDKGIIKIFLLRKKLDPYKGYWMLPGSILREDESLEENLDEVFSSKIKLDNVEMRQGRVFGDVDRIVNNRVVAINYIGLVDFTTVDLKQEIEDVEYQWFNISQIPKAAFDHNDIIAGAISDLKDVLVNSSSLKRLFPSDFTLREIQDIYEQILGYELDRRNFRKKFISLNLIEPTGMMNDGYSGRPAKLYRFKDKIKERDLF
jgi:8-oxo-dGTP diphosphatase